MIIYNQKILLKLYHPNYLKYTMKSLILAQDER